MQQALVLRLWQNGLSVKGNRECIRDSALAAPAVPVNMCECIGSFQFFQLAQVLVQELSRLSKLIHGVMLTIPVCTLTVGKVGLMVYHIDGIYTHRPPSFCMMDQVR